MEAGDGYKTQSSEPKAQAVNGRRLAHEWHKCAKVCVYVCVCVFVRGFWRLGIWLRLQAYRKVTCALQLFRNASKCDRGIKPRATGRGQLEREGDVSKRGSQSTPMPKQKQQQQ